MVCCSFGGHSTPQFLQCKTSKTVRLKLAGTYGQGVPVEVSQVRVYWMQEVGLKSEGSLAGLELTKLLVTLLCLNHSIEVDGGGGGGGGVGRTVEITSIAIRDRASAALFSESLICHRSDVNWAMKSN